MASGRSTPKAGGSGDTTTSDNGTIIEFLCEM
jgi:hypothetical protein